MPAAAARPVVATSPARQTLEGAGVLLRRAFGRVDPRLDPFLLLDEFGSDRPEDYLAGFPWHPHRGIETVTYLMTGEVRHGDSLGNQGTIGPGEVQWMTAGRGIIHEEMPQSTGRLRGLQLWVNLPARSKLTAPRYRGLTAPEIPTAILADGVQARVVSGEIDGVRGPLQDLVAAPRFLHLSCSPAASVFLPLPPAHNAFGYVLDGEGAFGPEPVQRVPAGELVIFGQGEGIWLQAGRGGLELLLASGQPLGEPVAWGGPIVMNTDAELSSAYAEYHAGTFLSHSR